MLPWIILGAVAVPLLIAAFAVARRKDNAGEHPPGETDADRQEVEDEFAAAERYQEQWREEQHKHPHDPPLP